jgi:hypothetical protein
MYREASEKKCAGQSGGGATSLNVLCMPNLPASSLFTQHRGRGILRSRECLASAVGWYARTNNEYTDAGRPPPSREPPSGVSGCSTHHYPYS